MPVWIARQVKRTCNSQARIPVILTEARTAAAELYIHTTVAYAATSETNEIRDELRDLQRKPFILPFLER
jgi:hypothetical protein